MYGGDSDGVELILHYYHELWSELLECQDEYLKIRDLAYIKEGCGSAGFSNHFKQKFSEATEEDSIQYVVKQWKMISATLNVPIDLNAISKQLNMTKP